MTQSVKLPDPVHEQAKQEANRRDISIGAVVEDWMHNSRQLEALADDLALEGGHRLLDAKPARVPEDAPRDENDDPVFQTDE